MAVHKRHNSHPAGSSGGGRNEGAGRRTKEYPMPEKSTKWPGAGGKTQSNDRSAGVKKVKQSVRSEGI